jgi:flavin-binding protein dodecin
MNVAKIIKIVSVSEKSIEDAVEQGVAKASQSVHGMHGTKITDITVDVQNQKVAAYKVTMEVAFHVDDQ